MDDSLSSLRKQLTDAKENLRLIHERKAEYVEPHKIDLQLIRDERHWETQIADLKARLAQLMAGPCPYRGLEPFEAEHAAFYFGRQAMVERLVEKVGDCPFVAVVGSSGCGKSSLVRAGLVTKLREGALPGSQGWAVRLFRPGADPLRALSMPLVALLEPEATEVTRLAEARKLAEHLRGGTLTAADVAARLREKRPDLARLVLVADQFEELYTECGDETLRQAFVEALLAAAAEEGVSVVLALRADFYGRVLAGRQLGKAMDVGLVNVLPMSEEELREAIEEPALKAGREFEPGLVVRIVEDVAGEPGNLPLLEFALTELWTRQTAAGTLTHTAYEAIGQVEGAIAQRAEAVYEELEEKGQAETVRRIFLRLMHYGEGAEGTRRRAVLDDLVTPHTPREEVEPVVKALADARLLVTGRDEAPGAATAEVAHEALIRGWARLRRWLDRDRAFGLWREKLATARRMWRETGRDEGALLRGVALAEAEGWLAERVDDLNETEQSFIQAGLASRKRGQLRRRLVGIAIVIVAILVAAITTVQRNASVAARETAVAEANIRATAVIQAEERRLDAEEAQVTAQAANTQVVEQRDEADRQRQIALNQGATAVAESNVAATAQAEAEKQRDKARRQSRISLAQSLVALAPQTDNDNELTALLVVEAFNLASESPGHSGWLIDRALREVLSQPYFNTTLRGHEYGVDSVAFSPDGRWLASGSWDDTVRLWEVEDPSAAPRVLNGHEDWVDSVAFSPDGRWLASGSDDRTVRLWEVADPSAAARVLSGHENSVTSVAFSLDGRWLASGSGDETVRLWEVEDPSAAPRVLSGHKDWVSSVAFSPDGRWLASGSWDTTVRLWEVADPSAAARVLSDHEGPVKSVAFSPDGRWLASGSRDETVRLWDVEDPSAPPRVLSGHEGWVSSVAFSPDGRWLASGSDDRTVRLWEVADPSAAARVLSGHGDWVWSVAFSPDGRWLASGSYDRTVRLWDMEDPSATRVLSGHECGVTSVAFSPDGRWLASGGADRTVRLWDVADMSAAARVLSGHKGRVYSVTFSPDGRWLASGGDDRTVRLWDMEDTSAAPGVLSGHEDGVESVAFSPDGRWLASGGDDWTVRLWDMEDPSAVVRVLSGHGDWVWSVAFSADGRWLASGSGDDTVRLWDMEDTSAPPRVLNGHEDNVWSVAFSPDGRWLASGSTDRTVRLWMATLEELAGLGCQKVHRNLTREEWRRYLGDEPYRKTCPNLPGPEEWDETLQAIPTLAPPPTPTATALPSVSPSPTPTPKPTATVHSFVSPLPMPTESSLPFDSPLPTPGP